MRSECRLAYLLPQDHASRTLRAVPFLARGFGGHRPSLPVFLQVSRTGGLLRSSLGSTPVELAEEQQFLCDCGL